MKDKIIEIRPHFERERLVARAQEHFREIQLYFNTVNHWNDSVRKPHEERIEPDPDGKMKRLADALAELLRKESKHKIPMAEWLAAIKRLAVEKDGFTQEAADTTDWEECANTHYLDCTPLEALAEDASNS